MDGPSSGPYEDRTRTAATVLAVLGRHEGIKSCRLDGEGRPRRNPAEGPARGPPPATTACMPRGRSCGSTVRMERPRPQQDDNICSGAFMRKPTGFKGPGELVGWQRPGPGPGGLPRGPRSPASTLPCGAAA